MYNLVRLDTEFSREPKRQSVDHKDVGYKGVGCIQLIQDTV